MTTIWHDSLSIMLLVQAAANLNLEASFEGAAAACSAVHAAKL